MSEYPIPAVEDIRLTDVLKALADPGRVRVVSVLADGERHSCSPAEFGLDLQKSTFSHHLRTLREAGVTETTVEGRNHYVRLRAADLDARFPGLLPALTSPQAIADLDA